MTDAPKKWQRFESLVASIQRLLAPGSEVTQDVRVLGHRSGTERQIDIAVRHNVGQYNIFVAIDCKDYAAPVDVKGVEEFAGLVEDVRANKGAMVAAHGFTEAAKRRAADMGLDLYTLVDAEQHDWQSYVTIPVVCDFRSMDNYRLIFRALGDFRMRNQDPSMVMLYDEAGQKIGTTGNLLKRRWETHGQLTDVGEHEEVPLCDVRTFIKTDGVLYEVEVRAHVRVVQRLYFGQLPLVEVKGFRDEVQGKIITRGFTTDKLDVVEVQRNWKVVGSLDELAVTPVFRLVASDVYPHFDEAGIS
jgi:hypothetical protein